MDKVAEGKQGLLISKVGYIPGGEGGVGMQYNIYNSNRSFSLASSKLNVMLLLNSINVIAPLGM